MTLKKKKKRVVRAIRLIYYIGIAINCGFGIVGIRAQIIYWALGLGREHKQFEEEQMVMNDSGSGFSEQDTNGKLVRGGITPWM